MARRGDPELAELMEKFVCVRVVQAFGMDLSLFQFDGRLTWAVFFMNADKTIYGRYGSLKADASGKKENDKGVSLEGFKEAAKGALDLHKAYPANKRALAGKTGPAPAWRLPEIMPAARGHAKRAEPANNAGGCMHCHEVQDYEFKSVWSSAQAVPDRLLWSFPAPEAVGLSLDPKERATVAAVGAGTAAEKAGFKPGDRVETLEGQPILSIADVQWVLHNAKDQATIKAEVSRGGQKATLDLAAPPGWRRSGKFGGILDWMIGNSIAGLWCDELAAAEKQKLGLGEKALALRVDQLSPDQGWNTGRNASPQQIGLKPGDVLIELDGRRTALSKNEFFAYLAQRKKPGQKLDLVYLRGGKAAKAQLSLP